MGLDMYLEGRKFLFNRPMLDGFPLKENVLELGYWRKHPNLHGYIVQKFAGGEDNCQPIELSKDDLIDIIAAVKDKALPKTEGFFFGASDGSDEERAYDLKILEAALDWVNAEPKGEKMSEWRSVVYRASW